jgi:hypothetical protein
MCSSCKNQMFLNFNFEVCIALFAKNVIFTDGKQNK